MKIAGVFEIEAAVSQSDSNGNYNELQGPALEVKFYTRLSKQISIVLPRSQRILEIAPATPLSMLPF